MKYVLTLSNSVTCSGVMVASFSLANVARRRSPSSMPRFLAWYTSRFLVVSMSSCDRSSGGISNEVSSAIVESSGSWETGWESGRGYGSRGVCGTSSEDDLNRANEGTREDDDEARGKDRIETARRAMMRRDMA